MTEAPRDHDLFSDVHGEIPGPIAGEVIHVNDRVRTPADLSIQVGRFGKLRQTLKGLTDQGLSVGVQFAGPRQVKMFVSEHPEMIKNTAKVVGIAGAAVVTGAVIYMHERHKPGK